VSTLTPFERAILVADEYLPDPEVMTRRILQAALDHDELAQAYDEWDTLAWGDNANGNHIADFIHQYLGIG